MPADALCGKELERTNDARTPSSAVRKPAVGEPAERLPRQRGASIAAKAASSPSVVEWAICVGSINAQSHQDRVDIVASTLVMPLPEALTIEPESFVELYCRLVPRKDVQLKLSNAGIKRPGDGCF
jgi:hypothetical protein